MTSNQSVPAAGAAPDTTITNQPLNDLKPGKASRSERITISLFVAVPFLAFLAAIPVAWDRGIVWQDLVIMLFFYYFTGLGVSMGFHRFFTHGSYKAKTWFKVLLAIAGSMALEGPVVQWVADHRRHHKFADKPGDPHSPWRFGEDRRALAKGLVFAHTGWLLGNDRTEPAKYAKGWLEDKSVASVSRWFPGLAVLSILLPALIGGLWTMSWQGALMAFFWGSLVRIFLLHHVTWSINSICHTFGRKDFSARDKSRNVNWLAILSFGESWHNLHHADPTCARHGALRGQIDTAARMIWIAEKLGIAYDVRWPEPDRLTSKMTERGHSRRFGRMIQRSAELPTKSGN